MSENTVPLLIKIPYFVGDCTTAFLRSTPIKKHAYAAWWRISMFCQVLERDAIAAGGHGKAQEAVLREAGTDHGQRMEREE